MGDCGCEKNGLTTCEIIGIILSIIAGVAVGILFALGLIPVALSLIIIALVVSVIAIEVLLSALNSANSIKGYNGFYKCICRFGRFVLTGAIGTFLSATIALTAGVTVATVASIIFVGLAAFFFVLLIVALICLISCIIKQTCKCKEDRINFE